MLVFGKNVALEYLTSDKKIYKAYIQNNFNDYDLINKVKRKNIKVQTLNKFDMDKKVSGLHQGIILDVEDYKYADIYDVISENDSLIVMLDHIEDPHNFGAIIRSCEAAGVDGIVIPIDRSVEVNSTVIKTSVGTTEKMKIARVTNLNNTIKLLNFFPVKSTNFTILLPSIILYCYMNIKSFLGLNHLWLLTDIVIYGQFIYPPHLKCQQHADSHLQCKKTLAL